MDDPEVLTTLHVQRAVAGERDSVDWLVRRFTPLLMAQAEYRLGAVLRRHVEPEDLVDDVWARVLPRLRGIAPHHGPGSRTTPVVLQVLSTTLLNRVRDLYDKHVTGKPGVVDVTAASTSEAPVELAADETGVVSAAVRRERQGAMQMALAALAPADREVVILRGIEQRSNQQVALLLGIAPDAASMRYRRALDRLRAAIPDAVLEDG